MTHTRPEFAMTPSGDRSDTPDADGLPAAYWRILPLHVLSEVYGLEGLRHRLVLEIGEFPAHQQQVLHRALALAERLHAGDQRSREPYLHHILRVTIRIASRYKVRDLDVLVAALLHDAVEDHAAELAGGAPLNPTADALDVIARDFGTRTAGLVYSVTNPAYDPNRDGDPDEQYRRHVIDALTRDPAARIVKLSDFTDNGAGIVHSRPEKVRRAAAKYAPLVPALRKLVTMPDTPLDDPAKTHILNQLDKAEKRSAAVLHS